jgi:hypothetical protein
MSEANIESSAAPVEAAPNEGAQTDADLSPEEAAAEAEESAKLEAKSKIKKYQIKANNKTRDIEIDWSDDKQIEQYLAKAVGADEKFQEAASLRKQVEQLVNELKSNPLAILKHPQLGIDIKALAQQVLNEELEEMQLSPEQKQIKELESKLKEKEEKEKALETEKEAAQRAKFEQEAMETLDNSITEALGKSNLPKSPYVIRRMADSMIAAMEMGYADVTPDQVLPFVEEQILGEINRLFESSPDDMFDKVMENVVGKKHLDKYRKSKVSKSKKPANTVTAAQVKDTGASVKPKEKASDEPGRRFKDIFKTF